ncbi:MAG: tRNA (adenosine(37)-N6)-threonylcarbamoyltransferase complex ATPase subunit type 1 TsaE [Leptospira sp.]|nr:tRNA (adenosine(37)-N6)-threonylcarbamoyltransferase complex ATPase subunit type 1 TsaE [Leptospira sp.]
MKKVFLGLAESELDPVFLTLDKILFEMQSKGVVPIVLLSGSMGAGKTTFVRNWFSRFTTKSQVNSPSFSLYNVYDSDQFRLYHFDLYRIQNPTEFAELGFEEIWGEDGVSIIEWWEKGRDIIPQIGRIHIEIHFEDLETRDYTIDWSEK